MFSIIMPVWNRTGIVKKAIESVLSQTLKDYELIIVDDGSEDDLKKFIHPYLSKKVRYYKIPHSGAGVARNHGIRYAMGDYIAYLDSDNTWHPDFLSVMEKALNENSQREAAYCMYNVYRRYPLTGNIYLHRTGGQEFNLKKLREGNYIDLNAFVHSREYIENGSLFDEHLKRLIDWDFILKVASRYKPIFVPNILLDYFECVAENAVSRIEDFKTSYAVLKKKHDLKESHKKCVIVKHDIIEYLCTGVSDKKYNNWMIMKNPEFNITDFTAKGYPYMLQIEPANTCNFSCPLCPAGRGELNRKPRLMKLEEFKAIIDDMEPYLLFLVLWDWGEPFMNPELPAMIRYASERGIKTVTSSNASFLERENYVKEILQSGLSNLIVAIDSLDEENYVVYRKKGDLNKAISGLENVLRLKRELKSATRITLRMVIMRQNEHELPKMREFAKRLKVDIFNVKTLNPSCGSISLDREYVPRDLRYRRYKYKKGTYDRIRKDTICTRIWQMSNIVSNGDVVPCCYDYDAELRLGNVYETPFSQIWNNHSYRELRKKIYHQKGSIPKCKECAINFELYDTGFVETSYFNVKIQLLKEAQKYYLQFPIAQRVNMIRKIAHALYYKYSK